MKTAIIIPVYNEGAYLDKMLNSIVNQTKIPDKVIIVNDGSTDSTKDIIKKFTEAYSYIFNVSIKNKSKHSPGSKVVNAFYKGYHTLKENYDLIGKFDGDIILPPDYFQKTTLLFENDNQVGIAGGNLYIEQNKNWIFENISNKNKVRGPIKLYRAACFKQINGLKKSIGWDTIDGLLAQFHGWKIATDTNLKVKHLKPTGKNYSKKARYKQGEAFYKMRYGMTLTQIASLKLALKKKSSRFYFDCIRGYIKAKKENIPFIVSKNEGVFIRKLRWKGIKSKLS